MMQTKNGGDAINAASSAPPIMDEPPPPYTIVDSPQSQNYSEQRYNDLLNRYEISRQYSNLMQKHLFGTKIVFILDDSGSMNAALNDSPLNTGTFRATRWDELKQFTRVALDLANIFNPDGKLILKKFSVFSR
jgi:hypothetical protein